jgi:hypothetical protein
MEKEKMVGRKGMGDECAWRSLTLEEVVQVPSGMKKRGGNDFHRKEKKTP